MSNIYKTSELSLAAYLNMHGLNIIKAFKKDDGKFEFWIEDKDFLSEQLTINYLNSEFIIFDNKIRTIKKMLYSKGSTYDK